MADDTITIEVDGRSLPARKGQMLIEVTDQQQIYVPRFCYHDKLSVAANCRMCLVEVEKAPKPLPACATPVMDGMKVHTRSRLAREAQKSVMEFLLINHPLDCPICDQGGECELQDLAMGYGRDVSRYQENKRVVQDHDIGPLVQTEMTRCIHCTRCVRFGEEIAGLRELGATGRGEFMEIGTYVERAMASELSGNVIDLCPVGALTSKPFRFSARTWEMSQRPGIAPHDSVGSNVHFHVMGDRVKRVVPAQNEAVNEIWLSDRDRFSYEGLYSADRLLAPMIREQGEWHAVAWETAFARITSGLRQVLGDSGGDVLGGLISPGATTEELYLFQSLLRGLGSGNIDHRLRQSDFSDQDCFPAFPGLGLPITALEQADCVLIIGGNPRQDQPLLNHRLRKAARRGARIMHLNPVDFEFNYDIAARIIAGPQHLGAELAGILGAARDGAAATPAQQSMARHLKEAAQPAVLLGNIAMALPDAARVRYLAAQLADTCSARFGCLGEAANAAGAWLAGAVPHRLAGGRPAPGTGRHVAAMAGDALPAWLLFQLEPELDSAHGPRLLEALRSAQLVVAVTAWDTPLMREYAHVLLPAAIYAETDGSYVNVEGRRQMTRAAVAPAGEARPGWKILRVLAQQVGLQKLAFDSFADLAAEVGTAITIAASAWNWREPQAAVATPGRGLRRLTCVPMYAGDGLVRRATALQLTAAAADAVVRINPATAERLGLVADSRVHVAQNGRRHVVALALDAGVADDCALLYGGHPETALLGDWFGDITLTRSAGP